MKIVVFGGTTEGRELSQTLAKEGASVIVCVVSEIGTEEQGVLPGITVLEGPKEAGQIRSLLSDADLVIDATHPYAVVATENIRRAAEMAGVRRLRLVRDRSDLTSLKRQDGPAERSTGIRLAADPEEAARIAGKIAGEEGRILLTTGSKDLSLYAKALNPEHLYARVLPLTQSIELCEQAQIPHRNIIAIQGPFSEALNRVVLRDYGIDVMITKESGRAGGFIEKISACRAEEVPAVVIARPEEDGLSFEEVLAECRREMGAGR